ncbi:hypothetical protein IID20_02615 [Patescibacteria group bacterium]|nr:hypothetical protein [Patescibacteria group bacterium]
MNQKNIRGYKVSYKDAAAKGIEYLSYILSYEETDSLFNNARISGKIKFEDRYGRNFILVRKSSGNYILKTRSSWF